MSVEPYSKPWLRNVLRDCVKVRVEHGFPWFDPREAAEAYAEAVRVNAMLGPQSVARYIEAIIAQNSIGPHWPMAYTPGKSN